MSGQQQHKSVIDVDKKLIEERMIKTLTPPPHLRLWLADNFWRIRLTPTQIYGNVDIMLLSNAKATLVNVAALLNYKETLTQ